MKNKLLMMIILIAVVCQGCVKYNPNSTVENNDVDTITGQQNIIIINYELAENETRYYENYINDYPDMVSLNEEDWYLDGELEYPYKISNDTTLTSMEIKAASLFPDSLISNITAEDLWNLYCKYEYNMELFLFSTWQEGFNAVISRNNGIDELLKKTDTVEMLYDYLINDTGDIANITSIDEVANICIAEIILSRNESFEALTSDERNNVIAKSEELGETISKYTVLFTDGNAFLSGVENTENSEWLELIS